MTANGATGRLRSHGLSAAIVILLGGAGLAGCATAPPPSEPQFAANVAPGWTPAPAASAAPAPAEPTTGASERKPRSRNRTASAQPPAGPRLKVGSPYRIDGKLYVPAYDPDYDEVGVASWYGEEFHGRKTADGERFNMFSASAAHTTLPLPSIVEVTNLDNGRSIQVRLNDRGPFKSGRIIDLSRGAADRLGYLEKGLARVRVRYVGPARPDGSLAPLYVARNDKGPDSAGLRLTAATRQASRATSRPIWTDEATARLQLALARSGSGSGGMGGGSLSRLSLASTEDGLAPLW